MQRTRRPGGLVTELEGMEGCNEFSRRIDSSTAANEAKKRRKKFAQKFVGEKLATDDNYRSKKFRECRGISGATTV